MNNSSNLQKQSSRDLAKPINKKKAIPISINTNPVPSQFLFKNKLSNIATSYKSIGDRIQNVDKTRYPYKQNSTNNQLLFNSFLSGNSRTSFNSQALSKSKNDSKVLNQRILPAKSIISTSFNHGGLMNTLNTTKHHIAINKSSFVHAKTENSLLTHQNKEDIKPKINKDSNMNKEIKDCSGVIKQNIIRQKSIEIITSHLKSVKHEIENKKMKPNREHITNHHCSIKRHSKGALSNIGDQISHIQRFNKKIDQLKFEFQNYKFKGNVNKTKGSYSNSNSNNNTTKLISNPTKEKIKVMNTLQVKNIRVRSREEHLRLKSSINSNEITTKGYSTNPKISIQLKERYNNNTKLKKGTNHSISFGQKPLKLVYSKEHNKTNELSPIKCLQEKIPHCPCPIQSITNAHHMNNKSSTNANINKQEEFNEKMNLRSMSKNNQTHEVLSLEIIEDEPTERLFSENYYINNERVKNIFDLSFDAENDVEDNFDDLNSIVRIVPFSLVNLREFSLLSENNKQYKQFEIKFNNDYDHLYNKTKFSERKRMNISLSTQESSCKKCLSPFVYLN